VDDGDVRGEYRADPWRHSDAPIRVMLGPQEGHFKPGSVQQFLEAEYAVTPQMDRMGVRVEGAALVHATPEAADIVSDGVTPGTIQVPGNGQPIILLADCQTVGGYPKIATVISADLPRLAHVKPGQDIRFCAVDAATARQARLDREAQWRRWFGGIDGGLPNPAALEAMASGCWGGREGGAGDDTDDTD
jgi:allophanate hydrolase